MGDTWEGTYGDACTQFCASCSAIHSPKQPGNDIDVYLAPLLEDLVTLWNEGIHVWDAYKRENFTLRAMLFCTINDFSALGSLSGFSTKGSKACLHCLDGTKSVWLNNSHNAVYMRHRRFLLRIHPYRKMKKQFDGNKEDSSASRAFSGKEVYDMVKDIDVVLGNRHKLRTRQKNIWKERSIF